MFKSSHFSQLFLLLASVLIYTTVLGAIDGSHQPFASLKIPSLSGATGWVNTPPLSIAGLRGKVIIIEFWTYTCINWRRTLPYTRAWAAKYANQGLVVIGVHTPEFSFEMKPENVRMAVAEMNIVYPVAMDNDFKIWNSFQNRYWPAMYFIDARGKLRYQKFGEGDYEKTEEQIQRLLQETSAQNVPDRSVQLQPGGVEAGADWENLKSPENYFGFHSSRNFISAKKARHNRPETYTIPEALVLNQWGLSGNWLIGEERIPLGKTGGKIAYRFHARDLHLVMGPVNGSKPVAFRMLIDGQPPGEWYGVDVDSSGYGRVVEQRMYHLIRQSGPIRERLFEIEFTEPGVEVYNITFG